MGTTTAGLVRQVEANLFGFFPALSPALARTGRVDSVQWCTSDLDDPVFNGAMATRELERPSATVPTVLDTLTAHGKAFLWWVTPASSTRELAATLDGAGLSALPPAPAMAAPLSSWDAPPPPSGLTVETVAGGALVDAMRVMTSAFGIDGSLAEDTAKLLASVDPRVATVTVLGARDESGRMVGTGTLVEVGDTAGLYNIATAADTRGRGVGSAITLGLMRLARDRGHRHAVLESSEMGFSLYESLGFRTVGEVQQWLGSPGV